MAYITTYLYNEAGLSNIEKWVYGQNWPVVYIIHSNSKAYVGETLDLYRRTSQHLQETSLNDLTKITAITSKMFNKSSIIDLESFLIKYMVADGKFKLKNGNSGISDHNYFNKDIYMDDFREVWDQLKEIGLVEHSLSSIENSNLFKYSPYKALGKEQLHIASEILGLIANYQPGEKLTILINGGAGTGKTILAVFLMKLLNDVINNNALLPFDYSDDNFLLNKAILNHLSTDRIGLVIPQKALAATFDDVFETIEGLNADMVIRPKDVYKKNYDVLIVDEAHRLQRRKSLGLGFKSHDLINTRLGLNSDGTQLDWIIKCSNIQILFYDKLQSIRPSDIEHSQFEDILKAYSCNIVRLNLDSQFRCKAGNDYVKYINEILRNNTQTERKFFQNYDLKVFDHMSDMWDSIHQKEKEFGLCRVVSGVGWDNQHTVDGDSYFITIENKEYRFRKTAVNWVADDKSKNEIGDIHKIQGYDLSYAGVIFGPEIDYDEQSDKIVVYPDKYYDKLGKQGASTSDVLTYVTNIYMTLMTRGIYGTYVYCVNASLKNYLQQKL